MARRSDMVRMMHDKGLTYEEIGQILGISRQAAWESATKSKNGFHHGTVNKIKYIGLRNWMLTNRVSVAELERRCGTGCLHASLQGKYEPSKKNIDAILRVTGLTYEECFKERNDDE